MIVNCGVLSKEWCAGPWQAGSGWADTQKCPEVLRSMVELEGRDLAEGG
jgi:hypothetical protein